MQTSHENSHSRSFPAIHYLKVQNPNFVYCAWFLSYLNQCIFPRVGSEWLRSPVLSSQVPLARLAGGLCFLRFSSACAQLILEVSCPSIWTLLFTCYVDYHYSGKFLTTDTNLSKVLCILVHIFTCYFFPVSITSTVLNQLYWFARSFMILSVGCPKLHFLKFENCTCGMPKCQSNPIVPFLSPL